MRLLILLVVAASLILAQPDAAVAEESPNDLILILDASNSMWGQIDGENKIVIARRAVGGLVDGLPEDSKAGLVAYGHRREGDCEDIETVQDVAPLRKEALKATINGIMPKGKTPITASLETAFGLIGEQQPTSVILISDGLETCSRDPCDAVRAAKQSGLPFVLHVVGFDVAGEDTTQLECAAQEGGGLFLSVENAEQLSEALVSAYEKPQTPDGRLIVTTTSNGSLQDAVVRVLDVGTGEWIVGARTYESEETNPRRIPLEDGSYRARVTAGGISGASTFEFDFDIVDGGSVERSFDFSSGEVAVLVTRNGELGDATVRVMADDTSKQVAAGRTYVAATSNPRVLTVPAGTYDIEVKLVRIKGDVQHRIEDVVVTGNERTDVQHDYASGTLNVAVMRAGAPVDAVVQVYDENGDSVAGKRAYADASRNPITFELTAGQYLLKVRELRGERREIDASVMPGEESAVEIDLAN